MLSPHIKRKLHGGMEVLTNLSSCCTCYIDADLSLQDLLLRFQYSNTHTHGLQRSCGGKGTARPLSQEENASERLRHSLKGGVPTLALTKLLQVFPAPYIKEGPLLLYKVLFWVVIFADIGEGVTEYIKGGHLQCKGRSGPNSQVPDLEGLAQILGR